MKRGRRKALLIGKLEKDMEMVQAPMGPTTHLNDQIWFINQRDILCPYSHQALHFGPRLTGKQYTLTHSWSWNVLQTKQISLTQTCVEREAIFFGPICYLLHMGCPFFIKFLG